MNALRLIDTKRDGGTLDPADLQALVRALVAGQVPDYQLAAFLMAVLFRGLNHDETRALTLAMRDSGEILRFPDDPRPLVDKHSTGGVGDKVSLPLTPLLACLGFRVPMISGRSLGITGGTLDKLESIPGLRTDLEPARIVAQVQSLGGVFAGQTATMAPADKILYALRDVTGTVSSTRLITSSILSKKLAEGIGTLILDVKFGSAAPITDFNAARDLARSLVALASDCGVQARALLTDMNTPVGRTAGNWLEVREAIECLEGRGPADLRELVLTLASHLLQLTGRQSDPAHARAASSRMLDSGAPRRKWDELIAAQGADLTAFKDQLAADHLAPVLLECRARTDGFVQSVDAREVGEIIRNLGGGRLNKDSVPHPFVGLDRLAKPGQRIRADDLLARVHAKDAGAAAAAAEHLVLACPIGPTPPPPRLLIAEIVDPLDGG